MPRPSVLGQTGPPGDRGTGSRAKLGPAPTCVSAHMGSPSSHTTPTSNPPHDVRLIPATGQSPLALDTHRDSPPPRTATHLRHALRLTPCTHPNPPPHDGHLSPRANRASPPQGITGPTSARRAPVSPLEPRLTPCPHPGPLRRTCTSVPGRTALPFPHEVPPSARHRSSQEHRPKRPRANNQRTRLRPVGDAPQAQTPAGLSVLVEGLAGPSRPNDGLGEPNHRLDRTMNSHPAGAPYRRRPHHLAFASGLGPRRANEHGASWTCR